MMWSRRGLMPMPPLRLDCDYPFGIIRWQREIPGDGEILILPALGRVNIEQLRRWLLRTGAGEGSAQRTARRSRGGLGDVRGVRPFRPGDPIRDIHWKTTARRRQLMVREYDLTEPLNLLLLLDPWVPGTAARGEDPATEETLDWLASLAMSIAWTWRLTEEPGRLTILGPGWVIDLPRGSYSGSSASFRERFRLLATLSALSEPAVFPRSQLRQYAVRTARLLISTRPDTPAWAGIRQAGVPVALIHPESRPRWYLPPGSVPDIMSGTDSPSAGATDHAE